MGDGKTIAPAAMDYLQEYPWPGNIRELASVLRVALQTLASEQLEVTDLDRILKRSTYQPLGSKSVTIADEAASPKRESPLHRAWSDEEAVDISTERSLKDDLARVDQLKVEQTLEKTNGNVSKAAAILGVSRETLHNKIRKYEIDVKAYRGK